MENKPNPAVAIDEVLGHLRDVSVEMMSQEYDFNFITEKLLRIYMAFQSMPGNDVLVDPGKMEIELSVGGVPMEIGMGRLTFVLKAECRFELDGAKDEK